MDPFITHLECSQTGKSYRQDRLQNLSEEGAPLLASYDLPRLRDKLTKKDLQARPQNMWRYHELLPVHDPSHIISLGEGFTPLHKVDALGASLGLSNLFIKDESVNPTGSFKARGLSAAVSAAIERGAEAFAIPSAGNAAGALAAYGAKAGIPCHVFMPDDTPPVFQLECEYFGAKVELVDGLITDCGKKVSELKGEEGWFEVSTLKEPYRIEGKKTMGLELAEQLEWSLPDVILYPTGGGTGLIGMWKAFNELEQLGWIDGQRPRMVAVQAEGCAPIVQAFHEQRTTAEEWQHAATAASGLRVPDAIGDYLILQALYESNGSAVAVSDDALLAATRDMAAYTGILPAPEGGATLAGLRKLRDQHLVEDDEKVVLFNTGSGYKYPQVLNTAPSEPAPETTPV